MVSKKADLVLRNGSIYTVDKKRSWAQAIAIEKDKIVYVGPDKNLEGYIGPGTEVIDLQGKMVLPGFVEAHAHPSIAMEYFHFANLYDYRSAEDYIEAVTAYVRDHPEAEAIRGGGWDNSVFPGIGPDKNILDAIEADRPVSLVSNDGHSLWVNSKALEVAGISKGTSNPEDGVIERYPETGEANGTLREMAMGLVIDVLPAFSVEDYKNSLTAYQEMANKIGITAVHDAMLDVPGIKALDHLAASDALSMRFLGAITINPDQGFEQIEKVVEERSKNRDPYFQINTAKVFVDGVIEGSTGYLMEPYTHMPGFCGEPLWDEKRLKELCVELDKEGLQIHFHAVGDAATHISLNALEEVRKMNGVRDARHLITHLHLVAPEDIPRFAELDVVGVPQPFWFHVDEYYHALAVPYLGEERANRQYPMQSFLDAGVVMASSSDFSVTIPCDPLIGIQTGVNRSSLDSAEEDVLWAEERASLEDMISSYTINGAYANFLVNETGSLEVGKQADLIVLEKNLFEIPSTEIHRTEILMTVMDGKQVFRSLGK